MTTIERNSQIRKIRFEASDTSEPINFTEGYPLSIYSPTGGPTSLELHVEGPTAGTYVVANDADDAAIVITLQANEWTNLSSEERLAMMGCGGFVLVNADPLTLDLLAKWST
jgi:hypothetical protein